MRKGGFSRSEFGSVLTESLVSWVGRYCTVFVSPRQIREDKTPDSSDHLIHSFVPRWHQCFHTSIDVIENKEKKKIKKSG